MKRRQRPIRCGPVVALCLGLALVFHGARLEGGAPDAQSAFAQLVEQYRTGDADQAVTRLAAWSSAQVEQEAVAFVQAHAGDPWLLAAVALLHTDVELQQNDFGEDIHSRQMHMLVNGLFAAAASDPTLVVFLRDWHILFGLDFRGGGGSGMGSWDTHPARLASQRFPSDAPSWLLSGSQLEVIMVANHYQSGFAYLWGFAGGRNLQAMREGRRPDMLRNAQGDFIDRPLAQQAEHAFRRALAFDPGVVEARLRLGRVLMRTDRRSEAAVEFIRVTKEATGADRPFAAYLAWLWLGQMREDARAYAEAAGYFERALMERPGTRSALIALANLRAHVGPSPAAWRTAAAALDRPSAATDDDPLSLYPRSQAWKRESVRAAMRAQIRRGGS